MVNTLAYFLLTDNVMARINKMNYVFTSEDPLEGCF